MLCPTSAACLLLQHNGYAHCGDLCQLASLFSQSAQPSA